MPPSHSHNEALVNQSNSMNPHTHLHKRQSSKNEQQLVKRIRLKNNIVENGSKGTLDSNEIGSYLLSNAVLPHVERDPSSDNTNIYEKDSKLKTMGSNSPLVSTILPPVKSLLPTCQAKSQSPITISIVHKHKRAHQKRPIESAISEPECERIFGTFIDIVFKERNVNLSSRHIYEMVSDLCRSGGARMLFNIISDSLLVNALRLCQKLELMASRNGNFLAELLSQWDHYRTILTEINDVCGEINYHYIFKETDSSSLLDFGLKIYSDLLSQSIKVRKRTISNTIHLIKRERLNAPTDSKLTQSAVRLMYEYLPAYVSLFEDELITATRLYYNDRSSAVRQSTTIQTYIGFAIKLILTEPILKHEYKKYFFKSTVSPTDIVTNELLLKHIDYIVEKGFKHLIELEQHAPLKALYVFVSRYDEIAHVQAAFGRYIKDECKKLCQKHKIGDPDCHDRSPDGKNRSLLFVSSLLQLKSRMNSILHSCFCGDICFRHTLKDSFEVAINLYQASSAQHIACYLDNLLESSWPFSRSINQSLDDGIGLLRSLQAEEVFKAHYKIDLGRRLLQSENWDTVKKDAYMAQRLKSECGPVFIKEIDVMIKDIQRSQKQVQRFKVKNQLGPIESRIQIEMNVRILSSETWSLRSWTQNIRLPNQLLELQKLYHKFYQQENKRRCLNWMSSLGTCSIEAAYPNCSIQLITTELQALILLLFNNNNAQPLSLKQICSQTGIDEDHVKNSLDILSSHETPLLIKYHQQQEQEQQYQQRHQRKTLSNSNDLVASDLFNYNANFHTTRQMIEIQDISAELTSSSLKNRNHQALFTQAQRIQACIMKILKHHRRLSLDKLQELVRANIPNQIGDTNCSVDPVHITSELDYLIGRELVVHDAEHELYIYCE